ncbi:MAG: NUDIX hydrolase [Longimicrobiales bacterium]
MTPREQEIPSDRLPEGFRDTVGEQADDPVAPRPAATVVLLRESAVGPEVLLLKRNRATGFVPGAYVFPGGRVDGSDGDGGALACWSELDPGAASERLGLAPEAVPSAVAYYTAAVREAFEETGLLLSEQPILGAEKEALLASGREALMNGAGSFVDLLEEVGAVLDGPSVEYIAHWVTPVVEPRRYDARFFAAQVPADAQVRFDHREMTAAEWLTPSAALERHEGGTLPMIFPTIRTLEDLSTFSSVSALFDHFRGRDIPMILPEIVRTERGVALRIPE